MAILLETRSDSSKAQADLAKLKSSVESIQGSVQKTTEKFDLLAKTIAAGFAGFASVLAITRISDELTNLESKLLQVTDTQLEFNRALKDVRNIAVSTRSDLNSVATLYAKISRSSKALGANQTQVARFTDLITKAIGSAGATTQETNSAILQLGQGLASGVLAGEELRAILENAPPLAEAIAKGLGKSVGQLKKLGETGQLTSFAVFNAILKQQNEIDKNFNKIKITYGAAFLNLKQSLVILFDEVKKTSFGATDSFAVSINNFAKAIFNFAINFRLNLLRARVAFTSFVLDAIFLFYDLLEVIKETSAKSMQYAKDFYDSWEPTLNKILVDIKAWSVVALAVIRNVSVVVYEAFAKTDFGGNLIDSTRRAFNTIATYVKETFERLVSNIPKIDIKNIIPGLDSALQYVKTWAIQAERWFFWLYDKVIGNSWIPDLVKETISWLGKLTKKPVSLIQQFVSQANLKFSNLTISTTFIAGLAAISKYKSALLGVLGILSAIAAAIGGVAFLTKTGKIDIQNPKNKVDEYTKKSVNWLEKLYKETKDSFDKSTVGRTLKQVLGMPDRTPGQIFGVNIDTREGAQVGRGPFRMNEIRFPGHDILNAFPPNWQVPVITAITGIFALAIIKAFEAGTTRSVLLSILTTAAGIFAANVVDPTILKKSFGDAAFKFVEILEKGVTALFSGNVLKDPLGVLSIIAKTSLLFEQGRAAIGQALVGIGTAPTRGAQTLSDLVQRRMLQTSNQRATRELANLPTRLNQAFLDNRRESQAAFARLTGLRDISGNVIGAARAQAAIQSGDTRAFGTEQARRATQEAILAQRNLDTARQNLTTISARQAELREASAESQRRFTQINERLTQQADAFRQGFQNVSAGAGGILGGLAGFQIGTEIAKGMTDSPGWVKVGVALSTSFVGQAVGAGIGVVISQAIIAALTTGTTLLSTGVSRAFSLAAVLLTNPFVAAGLLIAAAIATVLNWDTLKELFKAFGELWTRYVTPLLDKFIVKLEELINRIQSSAGKALDKPVGEIAGVEVTGRDVAKTGTFATISAVTALILAKFTRVFDGTIQSIRTSFGTFTTALSTTLSSLRVSLLFVYYTFTSNFQTFIQRFIPSFAQFQTAVISAFSSIRASLPAWAAGLGLAVAAAFGAISVVGAFKVALAAALVYGIGKLASSIVDTVAPSAPPAGPVPTPIQKATGGFIKGPGSGTSDSIPAMLSNGEFVVNAKDAKKNWPLLTAINSGQQFQGFAAGTMQQEYNILKNRYPAPFTDKDRFPSSIPEGYSRVDLDPLENLMKKFTDNFGNITKKFGEVAEKLKLDQLFSKKDGKIKIPGIDETPTLVTRLEQAPDISSAVKLLNETITSPAFGFKNLDIKGLEQQSPEVLQSIASIADSIQKDVTRAAKLPPDSIGRKLAQELIDQNRSKLAEVLDTYKIQAEKPGGLKAPAVEGKTKFTLGEQFKIINEAFPKLNLSTEEFSDLSNEALSTLFKNAVNLKKSFSDLESKEIGSLETGLNLGAIPKNLQEQRAKLKDQAEALQNIAVDLLKPLRSGFKQIEPQFKEIGVALSQEALNNLTKLQVEELNRLREAASAALIDINLPEDKISPENRRTAQEIFAKTIRTLNETIAKAANLSLTEFEKTKTAFGEFNINLDEVVYNLMSSLERETLKEYLTALKKYKIVEGLSEEQRIANQQAILKITEDLIGFLKSKAPDFKTDAQKVGESFAESTKQGLNSAISGLLKGESDGDKSVLKTFTERFLNNFTSSVIDTFTKGLMEPLTGEKGAITSFAKSLGEGVFKQGSNILSETKKDDGSLKLPPGAEPEEGFEVSILSLTDKIKGFFKDFKLPDFSNIFKDFKLPDFSKMFEGFTSMVKNIDFSSILKFFGFAEGGKVSGPGTGTSDSIPAMLSNGEFVINAKAASRNLGLLNAINTGSLRKFAEGGLVSTAMLAAPAIADVKPAQVNNQSSQQIINLTITGDISRQTKAEIYQMLPSIAEGVNSHNRERGYR
jgi:tape measure domain-containing protein